MKGARALAGGMLVLAGICAVPAVSAAQDSGAATTTTTPTAPADPAGTTTTPDGSSGGSAAGTPSQAGPSDGETTPQLGAGSPADAASAAAPTSSRAHTASSTSVTIVDFSFSPGTVTIHTGDTITWRNTGQAPHNATANDGSFKTPTLNQGQSASHTFSSAGTFSYICSIHPNMHGTVRVLSASSGGGGASSSSSSSSSGTSEASAVNSPDAAGTSTSLPSTGIAVGALALVGLALLGTGLLVRRASGARRGWISFF